MVLWAICIFMITITTMIMIINVIMTMTRLDGIDWKIAPCRKIWKDRHVNSYWNNDTWQYMNSISILFGFPIHFLRRWVPGTSTAASLVCCPGTAAKSAACRPNSWVTPWWRSAAPKTRRPGGASGASPGDRWEVPYLSGFFQIEMGELRLLTTK